MRKQGEKKSGITDTRSVLSRYRFDAEFTSVDLAKFLKLTPVEIAKHLVAMNLKGELEVVGKQKRVGGGQDLNVYRRVKKVEFSFTPNLAGGVWSDLFMIPMPVSKGMGRVYQMEA